MNGLHQLYKKVGKKSASRHILFPSVTLILLLVVNVWFVRLILGAEESVSTEKPQETVEAITRSDLAPQEKKWRDFLESMDGKNAYDAFKKENSQYDMGRQHANAHVFGELLFTKYGIKGVGYCDSTFAFGCYHSFFGLAIHEHGIEVVKELDKECVKKFGVKGLGCSHGLGHGVIYHMGPEKLVESLDICRTLHWKEPIGGCTSGVFMEHNLSTMNNPEGNGEGIREFDPNNPYEPCPSVPERYRQACYYEMAQWWDVALGAQASWDKIGVLCAGIQETIERQVCFRGAGNAAGPSSKYTPELAIRWCQKMPTQEGKIQCQAGASWSFEANPEFKHLAASLCDTFSDADKSQCVQSSDAIGAKDK